jgi:hypothetical protein
VAGAVTPLSMTLSFSEPWPTDGVLVITLPVELSTAAVMVSTCTCIVLAV